MGHGISMRELQKMSAADLRAMKTARPVKCGNEVVAMLSPVRPRSPEEVDAALKKLADIQSRFTDEDQEAFERLLKERGAEVW